MRVSLVITFFILFSASLCAQFPGAAGLAGSTAMHQDSSAFVGWATGCHVTRGYQDISNTSLGYANIGDSSMALGKAGTNPVVSLGDRGYAVVTFSAPIMNGTGFDFAVFENAFNDSFLELAFVEVSSDGVNFFRFAATSNSPTSPQYDNNANMDPTKINNLAGKYRATFGTPFDLQELSGIPQLNINSVTHLKIIDVVGSIDPLYASYDNSTNIINDPWTTAYPSSGFDLDAVGVINQVGVGIHETSFPESISVYPNPFTDKFRIKNPEMKELRVEISDLRGTILKSEVVTENNSEIELEDFVKGLYTVHLTSDKGKKIIKLVKE
jgi:hypothetical protein